MPAYFRLHRSGERALDGVAERKPALQCGQHRELARLQPLVVDAELRAMDCKNNLFRPAERISHLVRNLLLSAATSLCRVLQRQQDVIDRIVQLQQANVGLQREFRIAVRGPQSGLASAVAVQRSQMPRCAPIRAAPCRAPNRRAARSTPHAHPTTSTVANRDCAR